MSHAKIALVALPWHPFDYLSLQLGALAAYVRGHGLPLDVHHYYRDITAYLSYDVFSALHQASRGEALFAALLYPERRQAIAAALAPVLPAGASFDTVVAAAERYIDDIAAHRDWSAYAAVGFTLSHEQLSASAALARRIKALSPATRIFAGGALVLPTQADGLLRAFPEFDFAVCGEGEETLRRLVSATLAGEPDLSSIGGLMLREGDGFRVTPPQALIADLDTLPHPDFSDFFADELREGTSRVVPRICMEISRGCSWGKCRFCNLSRQWGDEVRSKSPGRVAAEIAFLVKTYRSSRVLICDTNVSAWSEAFAAIAALGLDLEIFAEVSVHLERETLETMRAAGVRSVQVGIESFSDHLLRCYRKGVKVIRNLEMLKWCAELGIKIGYNLIIRYPNETQDDVDRTAEVMRFARHFAPPSLVNYSLSYGSEAFLHPEPHNIKGYSIPDYYSQVYGPEVAEAAAPLLTLWIVPEPLRPPATDWSRVEAMADAWRQAWRRNPDAPRLVWRDCGDFLIVDETPEPGQAARSWRLSGTHRRVYLACDRIARKLSDLAADLDLPEAEIAAAAAQLHEFGILYHSDGLAFSIGIHDP